MHQAQQRVIELQKQGASYEVVEEAKMDMVRDMFKQLENDDELEDFDDYMRDLNVGKYD